MVGCLALACKVGPAGLLRHPEDVFGKVFVRVFGGGRVLGQQCRLFGLEGVRDVLEEDQAKRYVLVVRGLQILAQLVGGQEQLGLEAKIGPVAVHGFGSHFFPVFLVPSVLLVPQCGLVMAIASVFPNAGNGSLLPCLAPLHRVRRRASRTAQRGRLITLEAFDSGPYSVALIDNSPPADTRPPRLPRGWETFRGSVQTRYHNRDNPEPMIPLALLIGDDWTTRQGWC